MAFSTKRSAIDDRDLEHAMGDLRCNYACATVRGARGGLRRRDLDVKLVPSARGITLAEHDNDA